MHKIQGSTGNYVFTEEVHEAPGRSRRSTVTGMAPQITHTPPTSGLAGGRGMMRKTSVGMMVRRSTRWNLIADNVHQAGQDLPMNGRKPIKRPTIVGVASRLMDGNSMSSRLLDKEITKLKRVQEAEDRKELKQKEETFEMERRIKERNLLRGAKQLAIFGAYRKISMVTQKGEALTPIDRFRKIVRLLCFLLKVKSSTDRKYSQPQHTVVFEQLQELAEAGGDDDGMAFDPKYFKAIREVQLSQDAVHILSLAPGTRTDDQIQAALAALKASVAAFGEYPLKMQKRLVTVGWFERFEAKRVIIRQGHRAENFYFILSGTALVTLLIADSSTGEQRSNTVAVLGKGSSFGELALLHHKTRSATVLCKDEVALLAVGREDFRDIFMSYEDGKEPDHIKFLRTVPYLKDIPLDQCARRHDLCLFHYFRRGVVIVKNSNTEWIYIMKTGSCRVLTNLEKKKASLSPTLVNDAERLFNLPAIPVDETERRRVLYTASGERSRGTWSPLKKRPRTEPGTTKRDDLSLPAIAEESNKFKKTVKKVNFALPWIDRLNEKDVKEQMEAHRERIETLHRKLTHENLMRQNSLNAKTDKNNNNTKTEHVCVQIEVLKPKDQFGLSEILHDNKAVKCHLVSNGAECILIKKSWFLQNAGESILRLLRGQISPYPTQQTLEQNLLDQANWESFKSQTINDLLDTLHL